MNYVFVHGAWGGGHFDQLISELQGHGHQAFKVLLKGMGARISELSPAITMGDHVNDVLEQIEKAGFERFVLVGHSYGGMVITRVSALLGARIDALVYLDAFLPQDGEALWDIASDWERQHYIDAQRDTPGLVGPLPFITSADKQRQPLLTITEAVRLGGDEALVPKRVYVFATNGSPGTFGKFRDRAATEDGWQLYELEGRHSIHLDQPEQVRDILLSLSQGE